MKNSRIVTWLALSLSLCVIHASATAKAAECVAMKHQMSLKDPVLREIRSDGAAFRKLDEFSGLAIVADSASPDGFSFWTIDDENDFVIRFLVTGEIVEAVRIEGGEDLEAIAFDQSKDRLAILSEHAGRVRFLERKGARGFQETAGFTIAELPGYNEKPDNDSSGNSLKDYYENYTQFEKARGERPNSGWEGMTFTGDGRMYFVKEKNPAILIEVVLNEADLAQSKIEKAIMLNCGSRKDGRLCAAFEKNRFIFDDEVMVNGNDENLDFSGLAFSNGKLWMTTDQGRAVILFYPEGPREYSSFPLEYKKDKCLDSPEGVVVWDDGKQLFIINDQPAQDDSRLLIYDIE